MTIKKAAEGEIKWEKWQWCGYIYKVDALSNYNMVILEMKTRANVRFDSITKTLKGKIAINFCLKYNIIFSL